MLGKIRERVRDVVRPSSVSIATTALVIFLLIGVGTAAAAPSELEKVKDVLWDIGRALQIIVLGYAVPNGAIGLIEYMSASGSVEKEQQGIRRLMKTGIAVVGVALLETGVQAIQMILSGEGLGFGGDDSSGGSGGGSGGSGGGSESLAEPGELIGDATATLDVSAVQTEGARLVTDAIHHVGTIDVTIVTHWLG